MADRETLLTYTPSGDIAREGHHRTLADMDRPVLNGRQVARRGGKDRAERSMLGRASFVHCALRDVEPGDETSASENAVITTLATAGCASWAQAPIRHAQQPGNCHANICRTLTAPGETR